MFRASPPAYETNLCDPVMIEMDTYEPIMMEIDTNDLDTVIVHHTTHSESQMDTYEPITMEIDTDDLDTVIVHHTTHSESQSTYSDAADANKMLAIQKVSCLRRPTAPLYIKLLNADHHAD